MIQREIKIKLRNTKIIFLINYREEQKVIDIINQLIVDLKLPQNAPNLKLFYKGQSLDTSQTLDQQGISQINLVIEMEFSDKIIVTVHNQNLDNQQLKCEIITSLDELGSILLKRLNLNKDYQVIFGMRGQELNKARNLIEIAPWENITYQIFSQNYFIYDSQQYQLEIDVTKTISNICEIIGQKININSQQISIDQLNKEDPFYFYQVNPKTELKLKILDIQNDNQITISIVYVQMTRQMKILKDQKLEALINKTKTSFFPHNHSQVNVKLVFNGIELLSHNTINQYEIVNNSVIQLIVTNMLEKFQICFQHKDKPELKKKTKISLDEQLSVVDNQVFCNKQMDYFYQGKQLDKKQTFRQLQITKNDTLIEYKPIDGVQLLIKFQNIDQQNPIEYQVQSNELLSKYIYELIGRDMKDVWVSYKNQTIDNIDQTFSALQIQNDIIYYQPRQVLLQVQYKDNLYDIYQKSEQCVINLFINLRNYFKIDEQQEFQLLYGNEIVSNQQLCKKLWAANEKCYKIILIEKDQNNRKTTLYKIYFVNQNKQVQLQMNPDQTINDLQQAFLSQQSYPKNQPIEIYLKDKPNQIIEKQDHLNKFPENEFQIEIKQIIYVKAYDKIKKDETYEAFQLNSKISDIQQKLKLEHKNCNFYYNNQILNLNKTLQEIEFYDMDTIEYEILNISLIQIIVIEKNQQIDILLDEQLTVKDLRQQLNLRSIEEAELLLNDQNSVKDEQKLKEIAKDGKLTLTLKEKIRIPPQQINKCTLIISIKDQKHQIEFDSNKKVEDLKLFIIQKYEQQNDIVIRQGNTILNLSDPIPKSSDILIVSPLTIKVIIKINKLKNQTHQKQYKPNQKIGDIIQDFIKQNKSLSNNIKLVLNNQILDVNKTLKELGITDGTELNLQI